MMNKVVIYHNPNCRKSRETLEIIKDKGYNPEIREYLKDTPTIEELDELVKKLGCESKEIFRKSENIYKTLGLKNKQLPGRKLLEYIVQYPILLERPIVIKGQRAVIGRPPDEVKKIL